MPKQGNEGRAKRLAWICHDEFEGRTWRITPILLDGELFFTLENSDFGLVPAALKRVGFPTPQAAMRKVREIQEERNRCFEERWKQCAVVLLG